MWKSKITFSVVTSLVLIGCGGSGSTPKASPAPGSSTAPTSTPVPGASTSPTTSPTTSPSSALPPSASSAPIIPGELEEYDSAATPAKADLTHANLTLGKDGGDTVNVDENGNLEDPVSVPADAKVEDYYKLDLSGLTFDKNFEWSPADLIVTVKDGDNSIDIKVKDAQIRVVDGKLETKLLKDITKVVATDTQDGTTKTYTATVKKEVIDTDLKVDIGNLLDITDASDAKTQELKDKLQAYLDDKGKTYDFTMKVRSTNLDMEDIKGQLKT